MLHFDDTVIAFSDKSKRELRRAYWLFSMVGSRIFVTLGEWLLRIALLIGFPFGWALKPTVFAHFCGGEDIAGCEPTVRRLAESGIKSILDYSAEGGETEADFDMTQRQLLMIIDKAKDDASVPYAVFKPTGMVRLAVLEKQQRGDELTVNEEAELKLFRNRVVRVCDYARDNNVPVMVDAEESWIQDVVDQLVDELMRKYNTTRPLIYNTIQLYRHDRLAYLKRIYAEAQPQPQPQPLNGIPHIRSGLRFAQPQPQPQSYIPAFKLVRGAYMEKERQRARTLGYPSPVYFDKQSTDAAYDQAVTFCLDRIGKMAICIGTHNEESCVSAAVRMAELHIAKENPHVSFAQLLGMSDHISYKLALEGFNVCKYVPYGSVKTVVPYLVRRAKENTSVAGQSSRELYLIRQELKRRKVTLS